MLLDLSFQIVTTFLVNALQIKEEDLIADHVNPILDGRGGANLPPSWFLNIAQKPLGLGR